MPVIGTCQSPIQLITADALQLAKPKDVLCIAYINKIYHGTFVFTEPHHGYFEIDAPSSTDTYPLASFRGHTFELRRIHIHRKSEHVINAIMQADYEVHFVHAQQGKSLADPKLVIGILYHENATTPAGKGFEKFNELLRQRANAINSLRSLEASDTVPTGDVNPLDFFPRASDGQSPDLANWFHYEGSLTTEPFSEDVSWFVMKNESKIDPKKLAEMEQYAEQLARPLQALNRRIVVSGF